MAEATAPTKLPTATNAATVPSRQASRKLKTTSRMPRMESRVSRRNRKRSSRMITTAWPRESRAVCGKGGGVEDEKCLFF